MKEVVSRLEKRIAKSIKKAKKQQKKAKKAKDERYFEGQKDALERVLLDVKILRDEFIPYTYDMEDLPVEEPIQAPKTISAAEVLLNEALAKEVIIRKTSYYLHDSFPTGKAHGKRKALDLLEQEDIAAVLQQQLTEAAD